MAEEEVQDCADVTMKLLALIQADQEVEPGQEVGRPRYILHALTSSCLLLLVKHSHLECIEHLYTASPAMNQALKHYYRVGEHLTFKPSQ